VASPLHRRPDMAGVKRFEDLISYQLAVEIRREVLRLTRGERVRRDYRFLHQIRDAARSAPRNIAEGYSRFNPTEIHQFLSYAKASLDEVKNHIVDGCQESYFTEPERDHVVTLVKRAIGALLRWMEYLESPAARRFYERHKQRRRTTEFVPRRASVSDTKT
jgi:four helix bundle protein